MKHNFKKWLMLKITLIVMAITQTSLAQVPTYTVSSDAENWDCGLDNSMMQQLALDTGFIGRMTRYNYALENPKGGNQTQSGAPYIVPVVFHIIETGAVSAITYAQIQWQMAEINAAFNNQLQQFIGKPGGPKNVNTLIEFRLACVAQNCGAGFTNPAQPGVMRYLNVSNTNILNQGVLTPTTFNPMLALTHPASCPNTFPFANYLNIWCVPSIGGGGVIGYGTFPWLGAGIDGIVMDVDAVGNNSYPTNFPLIAQLNKGAILAHEIGHYLGLYHTFQPQTLGCTMSPVLSGGLGCYGTAIGAGTCEGDLILDTPPTSIAQDLGSIATINSCHETNFPYGGSVADVSDQLENYMSYSDDDKLNTFTAGQAARLQSAFTTPGPRFNLNNPTNLIATGVNPNTCANQTNLLTAMFNYSIALGGSCTSVNVQFTNPTSIGTMTAGTTYNWQFGDGTSGTGPNPMHTYSSPPNAYTATLTVTNGASTQTFSNVITIPSGQASIVNQSSSGLIVCKGLEQTIFVRFQNNVPAAQITDGTTIYTVYNNYFPWAVPSPTATQDVPFTIPLNTIGTVVFNMVPAVCSGTNLGSATFSVIECCSNMVQNGDMEMGNSLFYTDHCMPSTNQTASPGTAAVNIPSLVYSGGAVNLPASGSNIMFVDGCITSLNGNPSCSGITSNTVPNVCSNIGTRRVFFGQTITGLKPSTNYYISFKSTEHVSAAVSGCGLLNLGVRLLNGTNNLITQNNIVAPIVNDVSPSTNNKITYWSTYGFNFLTPPTILTSHTFSLEVYQMDNFVTMAYDYGIDNINLYELNASIQAVGANTICPAQSTTLCAVANCGNSLANYNYVWSPNIALSSNTIMCPVANPTVTTTYTLVATPTSTVGGLPAIISMVTITVRPTFTVTPPSQIIYAGQCTTLTVSGSTGPYTWMPGTLTGTAVTVCPSSTTVYTVTNAASGTCTANNTATVTVSTACSQTASASFGTSTVSAINFPASTIIYSVTNTVYDMQGTITFTGNTTFQGYTLRMNKGTKLIVNNGVTLTFDNCKLFGCSELWYGIEVGNSDAASSLNVTRGTTIEDMYFGIYRNATGVSGNQSSIVITDSKLNKNYIGVQLLNLPSYTPSGSTYWLTVKNSTLTSASSITSPGNTLKPSTIPSYIYSYNQIPGGASGTTSPYTAFPRAHIGINLYNLSTTNNIIIGDSAGTANTTFNTFSNMDFGIVSKNAQLRVHNNYFYNLKGSPKYYDMGDIFNPSPSPIGPDEIGIAVVAQHTVVNTYSLQVGTRNGPTSMAPALIYPKSNIFKMVYKGISAKNCDIVIAKCNWFEADTTDELASDYTIPGSANTYVYYKAQNAIWVSALTKYATINYNYIRNYRNGIYTSHTMNVSTGSRISCKNNNIQALHAMGYCRYAINIEQIGGANIPANALEVSNNAISKVYSGITGKNILAGLYVHDNNNLQIDNIKSRGKGLVLSFNHFGIYMLGVQNARIEKNLNVNGINTLTASNYSTTIAFYIQNSPSCTVTCNSTNNTGRGFSYVGNNLSPNGWMGNAMSNCYNGFELRSNGLIGGQGALGVTLAANTWSNVTQETYVVSSPNANLNSFMYVAANTGPLKTAPTLNFGTVGQFYLTSSSDGIRITTGTPFDCGGGGCGGCKMSSSSNTINNEAYSSLSTSSVSAYAIYPDEFMFMNQQYVYELQKQDIASTKDNKQLQSFYVANRTSNIGKFVDAANALANGQYEIAMSKNNSINPANSVQQKTKRMNELTYKINSNFNYNYSSSEIQDLMTFAGECSMKGWYVVQARNILNTISGQILYYDDNCDDSNANLSITNTEDAIVSSLEKQPEFTLFPNPNKGAMTLLYNLVEATHGKMQLVDVTGKLIKEYNLQNTYGSIEINEEALTNGIYFYRILISEKVIKTDKIVIIK